MVVAVGTRTKFFALGDTLAYEAGQASPNLAKAAYTVSLFQTHRTKTPRNFWGVCRGIQTRLSLCAGACNASANRLSHLRRSHTNNFPQPNYTYNPTIFTRKIWPSDRNCDDSDHRTLCAPRKLVRCEGNDEDYGI